MVSESQRVAARERQRRRRAERRRIDYYPSPEAAAVMDSLRHKGRAANASSIIDKAVTELAARDRKPLDMSMQGRRRTIIAEREQ